MTHLSSHYATCKVKLFLWHVKLHSPSTGSRVDKVMCLMVHDGAGKIYIGLVEWRMFAIGLSCCGMVGFFSSQVFLEWWKL